MNYIKIHNLIIEKAKNRILYDVYTEKHHIIPKCLNGTNSKDNIVNLLPKEHLLIHKLLVRIYPDEFKLAYALFAMTMKNKYTLNKKNIGIREYNEIKNKMSLATKERLKLNNPWLGKTHSEESKKKMSESAKNRIITKEGEEKRRDGISKNHKGKTLTKEHCENISKSKKGSKNPMFGKKWKKENGKRIYY